METFNIDDKVRIINKDYLTRNSFDKPVEGVVESLNGHSNYIKEFHGTIRLEDMRRFVIVPSDCELVEASTILSKMPKDPVHNPAHYTFGKFEVLDVLMDWFPTEPLLWQVVKYVARANHKGNKLQDLKKASFYLNYVISEMEKKQ